jgi:deoxyribonuclease-1
MTKKLNYLVLITTVLAITAQTALASLDEHAYYPKNFIKNIKSYDSEEITEKLRKVLAFYHERTDGHDVIHSVCPTGKVCYRQSNNSSYKNARKHLFGEIDLKIDDRGNYFVKDKYCNKVYKSEHGVGPNRIPNHRFINCEHTWPQSRFNNNYSKNYQKNDLHHLFGVNTKANSTRGKIVFGEVDGDVVSDECRSSFRGTLRNSNGKIKGFEPPDHHKGNVARAIFYFSVRYNNPISAQEEFYLRKWHKQDPVDQEEIDRNEKVYSIQLNRNPFIDAPELVDQITDF